MLDSKDFKVRGQYLATEIQSLAYYLAFVLYSVLMFVERTTFLGPPEIPKDTFDDCVQIFILILLITKYFSQQITPRQWLVSFLIVGVGFVSWRCSHEGWLFWLALFVVCSQKVSVRTLGKVAFGVTTVLVVATLVCSTSGLIQNLVFVRSGVTRRAMGFTHPNILGLYLLLICVTFSTCNFGRRIIPDIVLVVITTAVNLAIADSRSSALLAALLVILLGIFRLAKSPRCQRVLSLACAAMIVLAIVLSFLFMIVYDPDNPLCAGLNSALSGRLRLAHAYYSMQPLTLFGSDFSQFPPIYWERGKAYDFVVDNAFCHLLLRYGIVPTILFFLGLFGLLAKLLRERRCDALLFGITLMMVYGVTETLGIRVECDFFLVAMGSELLFGEEQQPCLSIQKALRLHARDGRLGMTR